MGVGDGSGGRRGRWPIRGIFSHISTLPTPDPKPVQVARISRSGVTASPVCSPSGGTKEYEIYGGVGFSEENAQIVASTAAGRGSLAERRVRLDPARPSPAPTSFDDPISGLWVAGAGA